jgi:manganese-dependent inorganic pyrophosphatase
VRRDYPQQLFLRDFKEFRVGQFRIGVSQVNIYNTRLGPLRSLLTEFMDRERRGRGYDILLLMLTDIINEGSEILVVGNKELVERAFDVNVKGRSFFLPGVISRKKQVIPRLIRAINAM